MTGAGVALDAAARGLDVVAVDANDLAFGTSRWSSKLVHGGLRYLAQGRLAIAHESAVERDILMTSTAPHLVRALPMLMPLTPLVSTSGAWMTRAGLFAGDQLRRAANTPRSVLPKPRRLSAVETCRLGPALRTDQIRGGLLGWDGQLEDDARLVTTIARTAAGRGARMLTKVRASSVTGGGADVHDELSGERAEVKARMVVNATGVWADQVVPGIELRPSRGTHLVVRADAVDTRHVAFMTPVPGEANRFVLVLPQADGLVYIGLTDEPASAPVPEVPTPAEGEIGFLLDVVNAVLATSVGREDVVGAFAGLRPLLLAEGRTADISREHAVLESRDGVVTIIGGKLTTYRRMAEDALDAALARSGVTAPPCSTASLPLIGAGPTGGLRASGTPERLIRKYGTEAGAVARSAPPDEPISDTIPVTRAELAWAVSHEGALSVDDLLDRRTRIGLVEADRAIALPHAEAALAAGLSPPTLR